MPKDLNLPQGKNLGNLKVTKLEDGSINVTIDFPEERAAFKLSKQQAITLAEFIILHTQEVQNG